MFMHVEEETRIQSQLLLRKQLNCLPTAPTAIKLWIVVITLSQIILTTKKHMGLSKQTVQALGSNQ